VSDKNNNSHKSVTLAELQTICARPLVVDCMVRGENVRIIGRRLRPSEVAAFREMVSAAIPPKLPPEKEGGEERYDFSNPEYAAKSRAAVANARAFVLFRCYPIFGEQAPADVDRANPAQMAAWLDGTGEAWCGLEPMLLDALYQHVTADVVGVDAGRIGFS
jgi:hypothetical protein